MSTASSCRRLGAIVLALHHVASACGCKDSTQVSESACSALDQQRLERHTRYTGARGFSFELFGSDAEQALSTCRDVENALERVLDAGIPGATIDYWSPHARITAARGLSDKLARRDMDADGLFRTASVSKTYLGTLAALLAQRGELDLDNSDGEHALVDYLPEVSSHIEYAERITLRQLLTHTSGVPDYFEAFGTAWIERVFEAHARAETLSEDDALALVYDHEASFEPGTSGEYSNTGYILIGKVISRVLGRPYQDELRARVLEPLRLAHTFFEKHDSFERDRLAHGYRDAAELGKSFDDWFDVDQGYGFANGAVVASARDVTAFFRAVPGGHEALPDVDMPRLLEQLRPMAPATGSASRATVIVICTEARSAATAPEPCTALKATQRSRCSRTRASRSTSSWSMSWFVHGPSNSCGRI